MDGSYKLFLSVIQILVTRWEKHLDTILSLYHLIK
jgi:hypothetical protein